MDPRQVTIEQAEAFAGKRLDRRHRYAILPGLNGADELHAAASWTHVCSGCAYDDGGYVTPSRGMGCEECGYTGKRRQSQWLPASWIEVEKEMRAEQRACRE